MDTSSLSPLRQKIADQPAEQRADTLHNQLRQSLSRLYKLENHDIFFVKSVAVGLVILSHLFHKQEVARCVARQASQLPASELLDRHAARLGDPGTVPVIRHVNPRTGQVNSLRDCEGKGVVDASDSFATTLHDELVRDSAIFITPLHLHASLSTGLAMIALRTSEFSTLMRSELRLFEASTVPAKPLADALGKIHSSHWQPYNLA
ncbi:DUF6024 family protein [Winslowiella iniecta]|uniref:DUF6024 family protein n=1 Tax=Winslowiella iniecta TaxID=1560201 RepID=UPI000AFF6358|nr:DUF6024 family protein [Winslowiella iniecta]